MLSHRAELQSAANGELRLLVAGEEMKTKKIRTISISLLHTHVTKNYYYYYIYIVYFPFGNEQIH